jgi:hypothetical protein
MGMWSAPWKSEEKAKMFALRMSEPWIAKVNYDEEEDYYSAEIEDVGNMFWEDECLIGCDDLVDYLSERAEEDQKDFDIREGVKEALLPIFKEMEEQIFLPKNLHIYNIVRTAIGLKELTKDRDLNESQKLGKEIFKIFRGNEIEIEMFRLSTLKKESNPMLRKMFGVPDEYSDQDVFQISVETKEKLEHELDVSLIPQVFSIKWERPGLARISYVLKER